MFPRLRNLPAVDDDLAAMKNRDLRTRVRWLELENLRLSAKAQDHARDARSWKAHSRALGRRLAEARTT